MNDEKELNRLFKLSVNPFEARVRPDSPIVGRKSEQKAWRDELNHRKGQSGCSLNFIIGDYGMGKTHALFHIEDDCKKMEGMVPVFMKVLTEDSPKNFGADFVRRIFKGLDRKVVESLNGVKKSRAREQFGAEVEVLQKWSRGDEAAGRVLTSTKVTNKDLKDAGIVEGMHNTERALEFLTAFLCLLNEAGYASLVLLVDEAEYIFSQMNAKRTSAAFATMRQLYDLPQTPFLGLKARPVANIIFFFALSASGYQQLKKLERVESRRGGPIQPLMDRAHKQISLSTLSVAEAKEMIKAYLDLGRDNKKHKNTYIPYTDDFVDYVTEISSGRPRTIIERCDYVIEEGLKDHIEKITRKYAVEVYSRLGVEQ